MDMTESKSPSPKPAAPPEEDRYRLSENLSRVERKIIVLSGKGGVGKSTVSVNLAVELARQGNRVGLLDVDIHGPSVPVLLGMGTQQPDADPGGRIIPIPYNDRLKVVSVGFLLKSNDDALIWRGPMKYSIIKQFLKDTVWGVLDYLIIDSPPGTGDEPLSVCQLIENPDGAVVVTTPQDVALADVRKSITFCKKLGVPVIGVIENMSGFICPHCGGRSDIFKSGGGESMAGGMGVPFLGSIPLEGSITQKADTGSPFISAEDGPESLKKSFRDIVAKIARYRREETE
ncbi:MAG TPA: ATP-binding protein [Spirochaetes bacterium]|nr:ATP-binding protein [Spirochaetota bacterium]